MSEVILGSAVVRGRKFCNSCTRWRLVIDFGNYKNHNGQILLCSRCRTCKRLYKRLYDESLDDHKREIIKRKKRVLAHVSRRKKGDLEQGPRIDKNLPRRGTVPRLPFSKWLNEQVDKMGPAEVAQRLGISTRRLYALRFGYYRVNRYRNGKRQKSIYLINNISFDSIDQMLVNWGTELDIFDFYSEEDIAGD